MKVLLIDADSTIPNLALMKLSAYLKNNGHIVEFKRLGIPYYPNKKKITHHIQNEYDRIYCSVVFEGSDKWVCGDNIEFGGTGVSLTKKLPDEVEQQIPDYSLYPDNDTSYGFITRGCIRNCWFCKVPRKEGKIHQVDTVDNIVRHKKVKFLDNNFLAFPNCNEILEALVKKQIKCQFNQGLDIRLITETNSNLLSKLNYWGNYTFAFDDIKCKSLIERGLEKMQWRKDWQLRFFVYCNPKQSISSIMQRIEFLRRNKCLPYIMRDISCWESKYSPFYTDLAAWGNQPNLLKKMTFHEFLEKRHKSKDRISFSKALYK